MLACILTAVSIAVFGRADLTDTWGMRPAKLANLIPDETNTFAMQDMCARTARRWELTRREEDV